jgi:hypothetical protein
MPTLNRFPLLGLWAAEAARRLGYTRGEAEALGHAYAVLFAIRKNRLDHPKEKAEPKAARPERPAGEQLRFGGDKLDVSYDEDGKVRGYVGGKRQTPRSYQAAVIAKFPPGCYDKLQQAFRQLLKNYRPSRLNSRLIYNLYDEWKKTCGAGRLVDLDQLLAWCQERAGWASDKAVRPSRTRK